MSHQLTKATAQILSAARLLKAEAGEVKVVGMPKKFWLCTQPTAEQELEDCCTEVTFDQFMEQAKSGLDPASILGLFKRKGDAESVAKKALRKVKDEAKKAAEEAAKQAEEAADAEALAAQESEEAEEAADEADAAMGDDSEEPVEEEAVEAVAKAVLELRAALDMNGDMDLEGEDEEDDEEIDDDVVSAAGKKKYAMCPVCEANFPVDAMTDPLPPHRDIQRKGMCPGAGKAGE